MNHKIFIPERFRRVLELHVVKNLMPTLADRVPLLLGIHGASGDGKTYQCERVLSEIGVQALLISGGQLESPNAGEPAQLIRNTYRKASERITDTKNSITDTENKCKAAVVLLNDVDTGLGNWGGMVQYTVNTQAVFGELMHLVDYPNLVEGIPTKRIPIIITGNDFTKLYEPLVRAGRMTAFEWKPTLEEKAKMVQGIFSELSFSECQALVKEFSSQPIAFFSHLKCSPSLIDDELWESIQEVGGSRKAIEYLTNPNDAREPNLNQHFQLSDLVKAGKDLLQSGQLINHLRSK